MEAVLIEGDPWDRFKELPPISFAQQLAGDLDRAPYRKVEAMEDTVRSVIEECVRGELEGLRAEMRASQEAVAETVLRAIEGLADAEKALRGQLATAVKHAHETMTETTEGIDEKLDRLIELDGVNAGGDAVEPNAEVTHEIARLAEALETSRTESITEANLEALASTVAMGLERQLATVGLHIQTTASEVETQIEGQVAALRSEMEATAAGVESRLAAATNRLEARIETMVADIGANALPAPAPVPVTNNALSPIRTDIRMVRNELAAVERAVAGLQATVERAPARRSAAETVDAAAPTAGPKSPAVRAALGRTAKTPAVKAPRTVKAATTVPAATTAPATIKKVAKRTTKASPASVVATRSAMPTAKRRRPPLAPS